MLQCSQCKQLKHPEFFWKDKRNKSGRYSECKECHKKYVKPMSYEYRHTYWEKNKEKLYKSHVEYKRRNRKKISELTKSYRSRNNNKVMARSKARSKKIDEKSICAYCESKENLERHHPNYDEPLNVIILCRKCHRGLHK